MLAPSWYPEESPLGDSFVCGSEDTAASVVHGPWGMSDREQWLHFLESKMASPFEIQVTAIGGPEVLQSRPIDMPVPAPHEVVLATAGSDSKVQTALALGADFAINYRSEDFVSEVKRITQGQGVSVVFDSVGKDTFDGSLKCLEPKGLVVNFGTASGQVEGFALQDLHSQSLWVCRPTLRTYIANRADMLAMSVEAFGILGDPTIRLDIDTLLPLSQASEAHRLLESRTTQGAIVLIPDALMNLQE